MDDLKSFHLRLEREMYKNLRKVSFLTEKPMNSIIQEGLEKIMKEYKKVLTSECTIV